MFDSIHKCKIFISCFFFLILALPNLSIGKIVSVDMIPPSDGIAHRADGGFTTPQAIMTTPLSSDQNLANLLDNNPNTFYQPSAGSNPGSIGSDVLLNFDFPSIPDNAVIESVTLRIGISSDTTDDPFLRGVFFSAYNRLEPQTNLLTDIGPNILGAFVVSPRKPRYLLLLRSW
ncbi:MAG: hypothetical protein AAF462_01040 [Thermodesulfobacteriota bacterium]